MLLRCVNVPNCTYLHDVVTWCSLNLECEEVANDVRHAVSLSDSITVNIFKSELLTKAPVG